MNKSVLNNSKIVISDKKNFCSCPVEFFFQTCWIEKIFFHFGLVWRLNFIFRCDCIILSIWFFRCGCFQLQNFNISNEKALPSHHILHGFLLFWVIFYEIIVLCYPFFQYESDLVGQIQCFPLWKQLCNLWFYNPFYNFTSS